MNELLLLDRTAPKVSYLPYLSEVSALEYIKQRGIYCEHGRDTSWRYVDVVAWGCVLIDVKESTRDHLGRFKFRMRSNRNKMNIRAHLFAFVCDWGTHKTYHVFPNDHKAFWHTDGKMKRAISYNPSPKGKRRKQYGEILTPENMAQYQEAWHLVEAERQRIYNELRKDTIYLLPAAA